jgi:ABC-2 type transport system permease protein
MIAIFKIAYRELKIILTRKSYYMILLVFPPILFLLYMLIYNGQALHNIPIAVWDEDQTELSRLMTRQYQASPFVEIVAKVNSAEDVKSKMQNNTIQGAVHLPKGLQSSIQSGKGANVSFYRNGSNLIYGELLYKAFAEVTLTINGGVVLERFKKEGVAPNQAKILANPINLHVHSMYNPTYNYQNYLVPGLMTVGLQMMLIMVAVLLINSEFEKDNFEEIDRLSNGSSFTIIAGKTIAFYLTGMLNVVLMFGVFFTYFNIPFVHAFWPLFMLFSLFILACIGIGLMVSVLVSEALMASDLALFYTSPAFVFSGFTFPKWAMPWYDQFYAQTMPFTPFLMGFFKVYQMNASWNAIMPHLVSLCWFVLISFSVAWAVLKIKLSSKKISLA